MSHYGAEEESGYAGVGRWLAVGSELPCSVIGLLLVGQILGESLGGTQGANLGAAIGAIAGFALGAYGVYITIQYYDKIEEKSRQRLTYTPSLNEIYEEVELPPQDEEIE